MVYSTCSFNPVENEAVVAEVQPISRKITVGIDNLYIKS